MLDEIAAGGNAPARHKPVQREHRFQAWVDRFLDRAVMPPMFTTGFDPAHIGARKIGRIQSLQARGVKFGVPDLFVAQRLGAHGTPRSAWLELKRGSGTSGRQESVHRELRAAAQDVAVCSTMQEVLLALRGFGFALHPNAAALADEYEMRAAAKEAAPKRAGKSRPRTAKPSGSEIRRVNAVRSRVMF
jgi:hypothetical protein